ncbi:hypothetical protein [Phenylobacterium sp.]|jgi:hypothetical protein|uniref:hypothetical protein n=1 Tax=Phenylobacterium sp. TaxID=1871053 RepID=UPI002F3EA941
MDSFARPHSPPADAWFRAHDDWFEDPCATAEERAARRRDRHRRWIASISDGDWDRLAARADAVMAGGTFTRLDDLDADIAIGVYRDGERHQPNGERLGVLRGCVLRAWRKERRR